jgi:cytochrome c553
MKTIIMLGLTAACALGASAIALAQNQIGIPIHDRTVSAGDANNGQMLTIGGIYGEQRIGCVQCHGLDGVGDSSGAFPRLSGQSAWYLYKTLQDYAAGLRPSDIMRPIAQTLTDQQMRDVAAHYASVKDAPYTLTRDYDVQTIQIGGAIAAIGVPAQGVPSCNECHGTDGMGAPPIYPALAGQYAAYTRHQLMLWKEGQRSGDPMKIMELIAKAMTDEQIRAVSRYYASVRASGTERNRGQRASHARPNGRAGEAPREAARASPILDAARKNQLGLPEQPKVRPPYLNDRSTDAARGAVKRQNDEGK